MNPSLSASVSKPPKRRPWVAVAGVVFALASFGVLGWEALIGFEPGLRKRELRRVEMPDAETERQIGLFADGASAWNLLYNGFEVWDLERGELDRTFSSKKAGPRTPFSTRNVAMSQDGSRFALILDPPGDNIVVFDADSGREISILKTEDICIGLLFSPKRDKFCYQTMNRDLSFIENSRVKINTISLENNNVRPVTRGVDFSLDGKLMLAALGPDGVAAWEIADGAQVLARDFGLEYYSQAKGLADGKALFVGIGASGDFEFIVCDIKSARELGRFTLKTFGLSEAAVSANGRRVAFVDRKGPGGAPSIHVWDVDRLEEIVAWTPEPFGPGHKLFFHKGAPWVERAAGVHEVGGRLVLSADGRRVLTQESLTYKSSKGGVAARERGVLRLWEIP